MMKNKASEDDAIRRLRKMLSTHNFVHQYSRDYGVRARGESVAQKARLLAQCMSPETFQRIWNEYAPSDMRSGNDKG